jgi:hypothetical protein
LIAKVKTVVMTAVMELVARVKQGINVITELVSATQHVMVKCVDQTRAIQVLVVHANKVQHVKMENVNVYLSVLERNVVLMGVMEAVENVLLIKNAIYQEYANAYRIVLERTVDLTDAEEPVVLVPQVIYAMQMETVNVYQIVLVKNVMSLTDVAILVYQTVVLVKYVIILETVVHPESVTKKNVSVNLGKFVIAERVALL